MGKIIRFNISLGISVNELLPSKLDDSSVWVMILQASNRVLLTLLYVDKHVNIAYC